MEEGKTYSKIPLLDKILKGEKIDTLSVDVGVDGSTFVKPVVIIMLGVVLCVLITKFL